MWSWKEVDMIGFSTAQSQVLACPHISTVYLFQNEEERVAHILSETVFHRKPSTHILPESVFGIWYGYK